MRKRPTEFYDIFLAPSVRASDEYNKLLQLREEEKDSNIIVLEKPIVKVAFE